MGSRIQKIESSNEKGGSVRPARNDMGMNGNGGTGGTSRVVESSFKKQWGLKPDEGALEERGRLEIG